MGERERTRIGRTAGGRGLGRSAYPAAPTAAPRPAPTHQLLPVLSDESDGGDRWSPADLQLVKRRQTTIRSRSGADDVPLGPKVMVLVPAFRATVTAYVPTTL